jgi:hypothetical protein
VSEPRDYTCEICGGTFATDQPLEEVLAETRESFGYVPDEADRGTVCDGCYTRFRAWLDNLPPERRAELDREAWAHKLLRSVDMKAEDLIPFDPAVIPWETTPSDWALCLVPEPECRVWVEHRLIRDVLEAEDCDPDNLEYIHGLFTTIGGKVAEALANPSFALPTGKVRAMRFTGSTVDMRVGRFGADYFVFLPRPEFEP